MRLINADALKEKIDNIWNGRPLSFLGARILTMIDHEPTIDAVKVVRCKDCIHSDTTGVYVEDVVYCKWLHISCVKNGYCHRGERKGGDAK